MSLKPPRGSSGPLQQPPGERAEPPGSQDPEGRPQDAGIHRRGAASLDTATRPGAGSVPAGEGLITWV